MSHLQATMRTAMSAAFILATATFFDAPAVTPYPFADESEDGAKVCLFESGTHDVKQAIGINDTLTVYRQGPAEEGAQEVGKVRILAYVGADYVRAVVVGGTVMAGDIARKDDAAAALIVNLKDCR